MLFKLLVFVKFTYAKPGGAAAPLFSLFPANFHFNGLSYVGWYKLPARAFRAFLGLFTCKYGKIVLNWCKC